MSNPAESQVSPTRTFEPITSNEQTSPRLTRTHTNGSKRRSSTSRPLRRTSTSQSHKERRDPNIDVNLPYRTLTEDANLAEYTTEVPGGEIEGKLEPNGSYHYHMVTFVPNDPENPKNWSKAYKWYYTMVVAVTCFVVAFNSSVITADIAGAAKTFGASEELTLASISLFVVGFGVGRLHSIPVCEIHARSTLTFHRSDGMQHILRLI